ncbi:hypothetical protein chiPu_0024971, partial [Chiloscyllium punctatum]|nr:hypothetical protein [Chiloscyllium punctatum]
YPLRGSDCPEAWFTPCPRLLHPLRPITRPAAAPSPAKPPSVSVERPSVVDLGGSPSEGGECGAQCREQSPLLFKKKQTCRSSPTGSLSSSPEDTEEARESSSGIEVEASDLSLSLTGDEHMAEEEEEGDEEAGGQRRREGGRHGTDQESSDERDSDSLEDTGTYSIVDEEEEEEEGGGEEREEETKMEDGQSGPRARRRRGPKRASEPERDSSEEEAALERWVHSEVAALPPPTWCAAPALGGREIGRDPRAFMYRACGARTFVERLRLQHSLEHHAGCVNTLHFNRRGTWLASGSDDLKVVIWDWARRKPVLEFDTGHKSNVFQVGTVGTAAGLDSGWC